MREKLLIRYNRENVLPSIAIIIFSAYAFSQLGWGNLVPNIIWLFLLGLSMGLLLINNFVTHYSIKKDLYFPLSLLMLGICLFWNNQDTVRYGWSVQIYNIILSVFYWFTRESDRWHKIFIKIMMICGIFYTTWTYICTLFQPVYENVVYPLMAPLGYIKDYKSGFTASYGTNGLYMCIGLVSILSYLFINNRRRANKKDYLLSLFLIVGMLLCGKRGQSIAVMFSLFVGYYFFNSNRKQGRMLKIIGLLILAIIALYFVSFIIPEVWTIIERFQEQINIGDVSTGRFTMWGTAWHLFLQKPFIGYGWRWFRYSPYTLVDYDVHNVFLQLLLEVGVIAAIPFYIFIFGNLIKAIRFLIKIRKNDPDYANTIYITIALVYETFFIVLCATGTALYQFEYMLPYLACCSMVHYYSSNYGKKV